jgi:HAE1 family hydrophobic/amphiphilic exporter-1
LRNISAIAIRNPMPVTVLFLVLAVAGIFGFLELPVTLSPDTSFPVAVITAVDPGASPDDLARSVTEPLEDEVSGIMGVHHVMSETAEGIATITVEFQIGTSPDAALEAVRAAVESARDKLPADLQPPRVSRLETQGGPVAVYAAADPNLSPLALSRLMRGAARNAVAGLGGVASTEILGAAMPEVSVGVHPAMLAATGLTLPQLSSQIGAAVTSPASGAGFLAGGTAPIRTSGGYDSAASLAALPVAVGPGAAMPLGALAAVRDATAPPESLAELDGEQAVALAVWQSSGADALDVARQARAALDGIAAENPGLVFTLAGGSVGDTASTYHTAIEALVEGLVLATLTVWFFLRSARATIIAAVAMPLSLLPAFLVLMFMGQTLNSITLLAMALVVGILVDDAIVEIENIQRHVAMGKRPYRAALDAADEIGPAVVATSAAIIAVFLPVSLMQGVVGQYFKPFGLTVAVAVFFSLLVARLFTPVLAAFFLTPMRAGRMPGWLPNYRGWLEFALRRRGTCLAAAGGIMVVTVVLAALLPTGFLPVEDKDAANVVLILPPGATVAQSDALAARVARLVENDFSLRSDIQNILCVSGAGSLGGGGTAHPAAASQANLTIMLRHNRLRTRKEFENALRLVLDNVADLNWHFDDGGDLRDVELDYTGPSVAALNLAMRNLAIAAAGVSGLSHVAPLQAPPGIAIAVTPKVALDAALGVTAGGIADSLVLATGTKLADAATIPENGDAVPVRLHLDGPADQAALGDLPIAGTDRTFPLSAVADIGLQPGPAVIARADKMPMAGIGADLLSGTTLGQALARLRALPAARALGAQGITELNLGTAAFMQDMFSQLGFALGFGLLALVGVMLLLFRNWLQPLTILATLPLSLGGAFLALRLAGLAIDLSSSIGLLTLLGIVTKNAILIVDAALAAERAGAARLAAAREAGLKRARPVAMTTIAMIAGMIPVALSGGAGASLRLPMAVALIGGLSVATILSLIFVPVFYVLIGSVMDRANPRFSRLVTTVPEDFR